MEKTSRKNQKQYPKDPPVSVYLGKGEDKERRAATVKHLANQYADGSLSALIQKIADGELEVRPKQTA